MFQSLPKIFRVSTPVRRARIEHCSLLPLNPVAFPLPTEDDRKGDALNTYTE